MLGNQSRFNETSAKSFQRVVHTMLKLNLPLGSIRAVYNYHHPVIKKEHYVSYAEVKKITKFSPTKETIFAWFTLKDISKLALSAQTKQDIIVGRRVIDSQARRNAGEKTIG